MSKIRINSISVKNYRSFGDRQDFEFPNKEYRKPVSIIGYNNAGKTNLMNAIKYGLFESVREDTFELKDFHNCHISNPPCFALSFEASINDNKINDGVEYKNVSMINVDSEKIISVKDYCDCYGESTTYSKKWAIKQNAPIYYINFHHIKEEISTQKTSWGNLRSFLGKHIDKLVKNDDLMSSKKDAFKQETNDSTKKVLENSSLNNFIELIQNRYKNNLRNNDCTVEFGLPNYEDIFLKMMFKIGLNGDKKNLVPIDHFGDGYISMFVMAVIQAIAESNKEDECLFLFEEPESFLHENHQEYFYKTVLCGLAEKGHQVIYTTHSDKMIDPFDTKGMIRLEMNESNQTVVKYNDIGDFELDESTGEIIDYSRFNEFIKTVEPNLSRMLFSKKVILVEGPNDVLVYKHAIKQKVLEYIENDGSIENKERYADAYMNFENISIICHHGKGTANYIIELCKHFKIDFFALTDLDFEENELDINELSNCFTETELKQKDLYTSSSKKAMITTNWKLLNACGIDNIHFNIKMLETVIGYEKSDKNSLAIWDLINSDGFEFDEKLFPEKLEKFIGLNKEEEQPEIEDDLPF